MMFLNPVFCQILKCSSKVVWSRRFVPELHIVHDLLLPTQAPNWQKKTKKPHKGASVIKKSVQLNKSRKYRKSPQARSVRNQTWLRGERAPLWGLLLVLAQSSTSPPRHKDKREASSWCILPSQPRTENKIQSEQGNAYSHNPRVVKFKSSASTWNMFNHAPIVAAARGTGLFNMTNNFNASALISVTLFCSQRISQQH
jgi:hypothetical protein